MVQSEKTPDPFSWAWAIPRKGPESGKPFSSLFAAIALGQLDVIVGLDEGDHCLHQRLTAGVYTRCSKEIEDGRLVGGSDINQPVIEVKTSDSATDG